MPDIGEQVYVAADLQSGAFRCGGAFSLTTSRQFEVIAWCISEPLLESLREMRPVLESYHISDILRRCGIFEQQSLGFFQSVLHNPPLWRQGADFGEVTLEGGETSSRIGGELFQRQVFRVVLFHEVHQVYLPRFAKVEQCRIKTGIYGKQGHDGFLHFQTQPFVRGRFRAVRIGQERIEEAFQCRHLRQYVHRQRYRAYMVQSLAGSGYAVVVFFQFMAREREVDSPVRFAVKGYFRHAYRAVAAHKNIIARRNLVRPVPAFDDQFPRTHEDNGMGGHPVFPVHVVGYAATQQDVAIVDQVFYLSVHVGKSNQNSFLFTLHFEEDFRHGSRIHWLHIHQVKRFHHV